MRLLLTLEKWLLSSIIYMALIGSRRLTKRGLIIYTYFLELVARNQAYKKSLKEARRKIKEGAVWADEILKLLKYLNKKYFRLIANLVVYSVIWGANKRKYIQQKIGFYPPTFLVISPTMRCNLRCLGCYANSYKKEELEPELFERIVKEANELGIYFFVISGGEPFLYPDLINIARKFKTSVFHVFTNGTLLSKNRFLRQRDGRITNILDLLLEVGNIIPVISVEGNEEDTDFRRGKGVYNKIMEAMDELKKRGIPFGISITHTQLNDYIFRTDEVIDNLIEKGAFFGWVFQYMPIDENPDLNLIPTPEQRENRFYTIRRWRMEKPIVLWDFWNDGPLVNGCIASSRYLHITSSGNVEPCVFVHFAQDNIREKSLIEILTSPFFSHIRSIQPYKDEDEKEPNLLRPCLVIDQPEKLRKLLLEHPDVYPTCASSILKEEVVRFVDVYSKNWKIISTKLFNDIQKPKD